MPQEAHSNTAAPSDTKSRGPGVAALVLLLVGLVSQQAAWLLAVPAFRGIDEIDHVYRASAVARGELLWDDGPVNGRGDRLSVPAQIVTDASEACKDLVYNGPDNCNAINAPDNHGNVQVATPATRYLPLYYAIAGLPSLLLQGATAAYGMRLVSMALCCALILMAALPILERRSPWHFAGLLLSLTPVLIYATTTVAPNGIALSGGVLMWAAWLQLGTSRTGAANARSLLFGAIGASAVGLGHTTGPAWVVMAIALIWWLRRGTWRATLGHLRRRVLLAASLVTISIAATTCWTFATGANGTSGELTSEFGDAPPSFLLLAPILWVFQSISAAPRAGGRAPLLVYATAMALLFVFAAAGYLHANRRGRQVIGATALLSLAVPLLLTWRTYDAFGVAWQGRYALPLSVGILMVAADALAGTGATYGPRAWVPISLGMGLVSMGSVTGARVVLTGEGATFAAAGWVAPVLALVGASLWMLAQRALTSNLRG